MVGNFYPEKRHADFLRAGAILCRKDPRIRLIIAGRCFGAPPPLRGDSQRYQHSMLKLASSLDLTGRLRITHFDPPRRWNFYHGINILLVPSVEGFGLAMAEAMAAGKPVVAVNQGGSLDLIRERKEGRLVPLGDAEGMAQAALEILGNPSLARRLGKSAALRIQRRFTAVRKAEKFQTLYDRILGSPPCFAQG